MTGEPILPRENAVSKPQGRWTAQAPRVNETQMVNAMRNSHRKMLVDTCPFHEKHKHPEAPSTYLAECQKFWDNYLSRLRSDIKDYGLSRGGYASHKNSQWQTCRDTPVEAHTMLLALLNRLTKPRHPAYQALLCLLIGQGF
ncbi:hypothetical protein CHU98_g8511 [Xylaria longipes]|nr:hypothetical protein CHU98_g8511 [Xylaria longipes]